MGMWNWIVESLHVDSWGVTPVSLVAPFGLVILIMMGGRLVREKGPKDGSRDIGGIALIAVIVGVAFLWIFAGLGLMERSFR